MSVKFETLKAGDVLFLGSFCGQRKTKSPDDALLKILAHLFERDLVVLTWLDDILRGLVADRHPKFSTWRPSRPILIALPGHGGAQLNALVFNKLTLFVL